MQPRLPSFLSVAEKRRPPSAIHRPPTSYSTARSARICTAQFGLLSLSLTYRLAVNTLNHCSGSSMVKEQRTDGCWQLIDSCCLALSGKCLKLYVDFAKPVFFFIFFYHQPNREVDLTEAPSPICVLDLSSIFRILKFFGHPLDWVYQLAVKHLLGPQLNGTKEQTRYPTNKTIWRESHTFQGFSLPGG